MFERQYFYFRMGDKGVSGLRLGDVISLFADDHVSGFMSSLGWVVDVVNSAVFFQIPENCFPMRSSRTNQNTIGMGCIYVCVVF